MQIINRHGDVELFERSKLLAYIQSYAYGLDSRVNADLIVTKVEKGIFNNITTEQINELSSQECAYLNGVHGDYSKLAARLAVADLHKRTPDKFSDAVEILYTMNVYGRSVPLLNKEFYEFVMANRELLDSAVINENDFNYDYFGFRTLQRSYLLRHNKTIVERPQYLLLRVSCAIHLDSLEDALKTYHLMSNKFFTHATPTMFNAGTVYNQMSSCFLMQMQEDSIDGIFATLKDCARISKYAGGIGLAVSKIRATGSYIAGTNGISNGLIPMLRVFNCTARYVDQGGGRRKGGFAIYLEPWHADVFEFIELRRNHGNEENRCRDLFTALFINDLFMRRVDQDGMWSLMCPNRSPGLHTLWGEEFDKLYEKYEAEGNYIQQVKARKLWSAILLTQIETGTPFLVYKDACNRKSNQSHLGTISSSNLCTEVVQYTSPSEIAVCNLASISLPAYVDMEKREFNFEKLIEVTKVVTRNLNKVIDRNFYTHDASRKSNMRSRPMGIGVQGLADVYLLMRLPFDSPKACELNAWIFETMYFAALTASCELAKEEGVYETYEGSYISKGKLQFDLWNDEYAAKGQPPVKLSGMHDWDGLREKIKKYGIRNSLLIAPMPTASTSQILGNCESFEPYTSNVFTRRVLSGEFCVLNSHLVRELSALNLWNESIKEKLIAHNGSVQAMPEIPDHLKPLFKTTWEIKMKSYIDQSIARAPFVCQSQSLSLYLANPTYAALTSMHFYTWRAGLKTGMYYLRTLSAASAIKFTVNQEVAKKAQQNINKQLDFPKINRTSVQSTLPLTSVPMCLLSNPDCTSCSG